VDTDVLAAVVLAEPQTREQAARILAGKWNLAAPSHWKAELLNAVWKAVRFGRIHASVVDEIVDRFSALIVESVDVGKLWGKALARAIEAGHPAYDVLFVELAIRLDTHVASYDAALQRKFPHVVKTPSALLEE